MRLIAFIFAVIALRAQTPEFGAQSRLVLVPTVVTDARGRTVDDLRPEEFEILDNGKAFRPTVDTAATGVARIALAVLVQSSGISVPALEKIQRVGSMIQPLVTGERGCAAVAAFDERIRWLTECTKAGDAVIRAFRSLSPGEQKTARLLDAVSGAIDRLARIPNSRRVILLISESRDRGSETALESVVTAAQAAGVAIYSCTYSVYKTAFTTQAAKREKPRESDIPRTARTEPLTPRGRVPIPQAEQRVDILGGIGELVRLGKVKDSEVLSTKTGGAEYSFARLKGLEESIARLGSELQSQYVLSFAPEAAAPGYHALQVRIARGGSLRIRARPGYFAVPQQ